MSTTLSMVEDPRDPAFAIWHHASREDRHLAASAIYIGRFTWDEERGDHLTYHIILPSVWPNLHSVCCPWGPIQRAHDPRDWVPRPTASEVARMLRADGARKRRDALEVKVIYFMHEWDAGRITPALLRLALRLIDEDEAAAA